MSYLLPSQTCGSATASKTFFVRNRIKAHLSVDLRVAKVSKAEITIQLLTVSNTRQSDIANHDNDCGNRL